MGTQVEKEKINETDNQENKKEVKIKEEKVKLEKKSINKQEIKTDKKKQETEKTRKYSKIKKWIILVIVLFFIFLIATTGFAIFNIQNTNIISGITVEGISVEGLKREEAIQKLENDFNNKNKRKIHLKNNEFEYDIEAEQINFKYDIEEAINSAYNYGRDGNIFKNNYEIFLANFFGKDIKLNSIYDEKLLNEVIDDVVTKIPNAFVENEYYIENENLIIKIGKEGNSVNKEKLKLEIIKNLKKDNGKDIILEVEKRKPQDINIEKIYNEIHCEPKDAYYIKEPFKVFPHVDGIDFDIEEAKEILKEKKNEYKIPLKIINPKVLTTTIGAEAFPDLLGTFSTRYSERDVNRATNLKLAASKINGVVVEPGKTFSYNKTVGERTIAAGYKNAAGYAGGEVVSMVAGGICQISSTLYDAVVYANLEIVSRSNHMFLTSYASAGKDATVVYGAIDFQFKNTRNYPILIKMNVQNGVAKADIYGIKEDIEYEIEMDTTIIGSIPYSVIYKDDPTLEPGQEKVTQSGMNGCKSITYKIKKLNGVEVSKDVLSSDTYSPMNKIISRGPAIETPPVTETPAEPIEPEPIQPTPSEPVVPETPTPEIPKEPEQEEPIKPDNSGEGNEQEKIDENPVINGI